MAWSCSTARRGNPRRRPGAGAVGAVISGLAVLVVLAGCGSSAPSADSPQPPATDAPTTTTPPLTVPPTSVPVSAQAVPYGPDPVQLLDIHQPSVGPAVGVIVWLHAGGWRSLSRADVSEVVAAQGERGWAVVSVDYRLAPAVQAAEMLADVDRSVRWVRAHGGEYGLNTSAVVVAGGSAGGHLAAMAGAAAGEFADPALPAELQATSPVPDAIIDMVGPGDLALFAAVGGWAPDTTSQLLGCALGATTLALPPCDQATVKRFSPLWWARQAAASGRPLPPAMFAFGPEDALVPPATQGEPLRAAWEAAAPPGSVHYDVPVGAGHNLGPDIDRSALDGWLDQIAAHAF